MPADDSKGIRQSRVLDTGIIFHRQVINIEEPLPGRLFGRVAAGCPRALEIGIVDHGQSAVEAFHAESYRMKGGERRQQHASLGQCFS